MTDWKHVNFRIPLSEWKAMCYACADINCHKAPWIRAAIKEFRKLSMEEQIEQMAEKESTCG